MPNAVARYKKLSCILLCFAAAVAGAGCSSGDVAEDSAAGAEIIGTLGRQPGQFSKPRAVAVTASDQIIVVDRTGRIQSYDLHTGDFIRQWRLPEYDNGTPTGISIDPADDTIWVADTHYSRILQYDQEGTLLTQFGEMGEEPGKFFFITDVCPDPDGQTLWISDYGRRNRIMHFTRAGDFIKEWGTKAYENADLERPMSIVMSPDGKNLLVVDTGNNRVNVYDREGELLRSFGKAGTGPGEMTYPQDMAMGPDNTLYIVEYGNSRVSRFSLDGQFLGWWGEPGKKAGQLFTPWGLGTSLDGQLIIADTNNERLQIIRRPARHFVRPEPTSLAAGKTTGGGNPL